MIILRGQGCCRAFLLAWRAEPEGLRGPTPSLDAPYTLVSFAFCHNQYFSIANMHTTLLLSLYPRRFAYKGALRTISLVPWFADFEPSVRDEKALKVLSGCWDERRETLAWALLAQYNPRDAFAEANVIPFASKSTLPRRETIKLKLKEGFFQTHF